jgi:hypothetical protein
MGTAKELVSYTLFAFAVLALALNFADMFGPKNWQEFLKTRLHTVRRDFSRRPNWLSLQYRFVAHFDLLFHFGYALGGLLGLVFIAFLPGVQAQGLAGFNLTLPFLLLILLWAVYARQPVAHTFDFFVEDEGWLFSLGKAVAATTVAAIVGGVAFLVAWQLLTPQIAMSTDVQQLGWQAVLATALIVFMPLVTLIVFTLYLLAGAIFGGLARITARGAQTFATRGPLTAFAALLATIGSVIRALPPMG